MKPHRARWGFLLWVYCRRRNLAGGILASPFFVYTHNSDEVDNDLGPQYAAVSNRDSRFFIVGLVHQGLVTKP